MYKLLTLFAITQLVFAAPSVVFDYNCTPGIACGIMASALGKGGLGLMAINEFTIGGTSSLQRTTNPTFTCPSGYCKGADSACLEYPFGVTSNNTKRKYVCVASSELRMMDTQLANAFTSNNIGDGSTFFVSVSNIPASGCI